MGLSKVQLTLTNMFKKNSIEISALVETGTVHMCVTQAQAR